MKATLGAGGPLFYEDLPVGSTGRSKARTLIESDLAAYVNLTWFTEELFTNLADTHGRAIVGRPVPALMLVAFAEGLIGSTIDGSGLAFLHADMNVSKPTQLGDTIHVEWEVVESRLSSSGRGAKIRTENKVINQMGETTLVYRPLRLIKRRSPEVAT